jgi:hypothetical protein
VTSFRVTVGVPLTPRKPRADDRRIFSLYNPSKAEDGRETFVHVWCRITGASTPQFESHALRILDNNGLRWQPFSRKQFQSVALCRSDSGSFFPQFLPDGGVEARLRSNRAMGRGRHWSRGLFCHQRLSGAQSFMQRRDMWVFSKPAVATNLYVIKLWN